ncbi:hypothetical protein GCM10027535_21540 [Mycolicibacterium hippocampi]|uniref:Uncharacterized protein n=1 Tax=Mycolicibacterium hippocampi TaxID=659824 RepID=A0A7I9ZGM5_9MYCO|nr:hypothetical protein MHIP_06450 [Mycolicibacterium hippocampi]
MPPKSCAEVASPAFTPDAVSAPELSLSGGAQPTAPETSTADAATARALVVTPDSNCAVIREKFIAEPSDEQETAQWLGGYRSATAQ